MTYAPVSAEFPPTEASLAQLLEFVERAARSLGAGPSVALKASLVIEELFVNTITHGGQREGQVRIELRRQGNALELLYADRGRAYDPFSSTLRASASLPLEARPVGGLGVLLVEGICSQHSYKRTGEFNLSRLTITLLS